MRCQLKGFAAYASHGDLGLRRVIGRRLFPARARGRARRARSWALCLERSAELREKRPTLGRSSSYRRKVGAAYIFGLVGLQLIFHNDPYLCAQKARERLQIASWRRKK